MYIYPDESGFLATVSASPPVPGNGIEVHGPYDVFTLSATHWWDGSGLAERPAMTLAIDKQQISAGGEVATISGLPTPATVTVNGTSYEITDGTAEIDSPIQTTLVIVVSAWPYRDETLTIEVV